MGSLSSLAEAPQGGVYRVSTRDAARLSAEGAAATLRWHRLSAPERWTREALLDALAASLAFPDYFGRNWDAAWDCLTELEWREGEGWDGRVRVILLPPGPRPPEDARAMTAFVTLMEDACAHWAERGRTLIVLIAWDGPVPGWLAPVPALPPANE